VIVVIDIASLAVFEILRSKRIGVMSLEFDLSGSRDVIGHVII